MAPDRDRDLLDPLLISLMLGALVLVVASVLGGGVSTSVAGIRISARELFRPTVLAISVALFAMYRSKRRAQQFSDLWATAQRHATTLAVIIASVVFTSAMRMSLFEARASDQSGYVSQAELWAQRNLTTPMPLAATAPWPDATWTFSP